MNLLSLFLLVVVSGQLSVIAPAHVELMGAHYPLVAIGGISLARAADVWQEQPCSLAVVSAITEADDYRQAVNSFLNIIG